MKKIINVCAIVMALFMSVFTMNAQSCDAYKNYAGENRFFDNWSIGLEGGVQSNLYDWNKPQGGVAGLNINKQFIPEFGMSIEGYVGFNNIANWFTPVYHVHNKNVADNVNVFVTGRWNLMNSFAGYIGKPRVFEIETNVGFGYGRFFYNSTVGNDYDCLLGKVGLNFNFNFGSNRAWTISLKPAVIWNFTSAPEFYSHVADNRMAVFQGTAGVTYHFGTSNKTHYIAASPVPELIATNNELNCKVNELREALVNASNNVNTVTTVLEKEVIVEVPTYVNTTYVVTFAFDSDVLTDDTKATLDKIPEGTTVNIVAYASPEGPVVYNQNLSYDRGMHISSYLQNRGVNVASVKGEGAVNAESNRIAIITIVK